MRVFIFIRKIETMCDLLENACTVNCALQQVSSNIIFLRLFCLEIVLKSNWAACLVTHIFVKTGWNSITSQA